MRNLGLACFAVLCLLTRVPSATQTAGAIAGNVIDMATSKPLPGANISVKGTPLGTASDGNGEFTIVNVSPGAYTVIASYVGYASQEKRLAVREDSTVHITFSLSPSEIIGQPITVTAMRAKERETPAAFSSIDRLEIKERYTTQDIPVLLSELPSSTVYSESGNNIGYTYLNLRGFDSRRIAVMVNGIPQNDPEDHNVYWLDFPDIAASADDIQVQRGAGSAFYGPPSIGGSINLVTNNFAKERSFELSAGTGSYNTRRYSATYNSGLIDNRYAIHARLSKILSSGYRDGAWVDFSGYFLGLIRYDENMTTQLNFYGGPIADGLAYYGNPKSYIGDRELRKLNFSYWDESTFVPRRPDEIENFSQPHYELFNEWRLTPNITLNNTLFLVLGDGFFDYDGSWAPYSYYRITRENGFDVTGNPDTLYFPNALIHAYVTNKQWGYLPRLTVKHGDGELIVGSEVRIHRSDHWGQLRSADEIPVAIPADYRYYEFKGAKDIFSLYVQELYHFRPDLTGLASIQYAYNRYRLYDEKFIGTDFSVPYHFVNPRIGLNYNIDQHWNSYLSLAYTSREPRLNNLYNAGEASGGAAPQFAADASGKYDFSNPLVKPESLFDIELGSSYTAESAKVSANLFWMEFSHEIVNSGQVDRFGQPITINADRTRHIGIELSGRVNVVRDLDLSANLTLSRNRIVRETELSTGASMTGNPIAGFPDVLGNFRLTYHNEGFVLSMSGRYVGKQYTDNFYTLFDYNGENVVTDYFVSDAAVSYKFDNLFSGGGVELKLQVNNIFNRLYAAYGEGHTFFPAADRNMFFNLTVNL